MLALLATLLSLLQAACATPPAAQSSPQSAAPTANVEPVEPWDGDGMDIPLDGSSLEAFNKSLERVKVYASPSNYTTLVNAIEYLLVYDLAAKHDRTKLAADLDGLTGHQVVGRVNWGRD